VIGVGVGASFDSPSEPAIGIFVLKNKTHRPIPATIDGVRTRVKETSPFRAIVDRSSGSAGCSARKPSQVAVTPSAPEPAIRPIASPSN
jgi:hypothetical protein